MKKILKILVTICKKPIKKLIKRENVSYYVKKGNIFFENQKNGKALKVLKKGLKVYPNSYAIHKQLANYAMDVKDWESANNHWNNVVKSRKEIDSQVYLNYAKALQMDNQTQKSIDILSLGLTRCLDNKNIILELAKLVGDSEEMNEGENRSSLKGHDLSPENKKLFSDFVNEPIRRQEWQTSIKRLEDICSVYKKSISLNVLVKLSMLYQVIGNTEKAQSIFQGVLADYPDNISNDKKGYRKIILFDNGESRIEFYKKLQKTDTAVFTFDSINMVWINPSFAFNLLMKQNVDIIAVRKRRKSTYQQDLSLNDYLNTVKSLAAGYKDKIAYGFSLGAYGALYYASEINCRILALSPRLSIHPIYGKTKLKGKHEFKHTISNSYNSKIAPIIVYDPKNPLDNTYVNKGLIPSFPNAELVEIPYGGHGMGPHLLKMGLLKEFILTVINEKKTPVYNPELRKKSSTYYRVLGDACLKRNKPNWALDLVEHALKLTPKDSLCMRLKIHVLRRLELYNKAIEYAKESSELAPGDRVIRLLLIDLHIQTHDFMSAEKEIENAIDSFGKTASLLDRKKQLVDVKSNIQ